MSGFAGLDPCVHCGFCLPQCPTYLVTGDEADGPRGRIVLMRLLASGAMPADDPGCRYHLDRCLGCRACEPVCPSGVAYGPALEEARARMTDRRPVPLAARAMLAVMARATLRRPVLAAARLVRPIAARLHGWHRPGFLAGMLAGTIPWRPRLPIAQRTDPSSDGAGVPTPQGPAALFRGCVQRELFGHVNAAAERALAANGFAPERVEGQGCCGALHAHAGLLETARALARENIRAFAQRPQCAVVATAAGCGAMLRGYGALLADDPLAAEAAAFAARVRDVTELLATVGPRRGATLTLRVAYDPPCHLLHVQRVADAPLTVLAAVPGLAVIPHLESDMCCGSAGLYALAEPSLSQAVLRRKLEALDAVAPDLVVTGNPGCAMQLAAGLRAAGRTIPIAHPVEVLDVAYVAAGVYSRTAGVDSLEP